MAQTKGLRIQYRPLGEIQKWDRNPKGHDIPKIIASIERFGFNDVPLVDEEKQVLRSGHGRLQALEQMKTEGRSLPKNLRKKGDEWLVPTLAGVSFDNEKEAEAFALAVNRLVELGRWDETMLSSVLKDMDNLAGVGWDETQVQRLLANAELTAAIDSQKLDDPELAGPDTRTGRPILIYRDETERNMWLDKLGMPHDFSGVCITTEDMA